MSKPTFLMHIQFNFHYRQASIHFIRKESKIPLTEINSNADEKQLSEEENEFASELLDGIVYFVWNRSL